MFTQERRVQISLIDVIDHHWRFLLRHSAGEARAHGDANFQIEFETFRRPRHQMIVVFHQQNQVCTTHGGQPMGDDEGGAAGE